MQSLAEVGGPDPVHVATLRQWVVGVRGYTPGRGLGAPAPRKHKRSEPKRAIKDGEQDSLRVA